MAELFYRQLAHLYDPAYLSQGTDFTGVDISTFQKKTGSRMQLAVSIHSISVGATLNATLENAATLIDPVFAEVLNKNYTVAGIETNILLNLNKYCVLTITVTGGTATYSIVATLVDNMTESVSLDAPVQITDPDGDIVDVNPDGSLTVVVNTPPGGLPVTFISPGTLVSSYNEVSAIGAASPTIIHTYTVPIGATAQLQKIDVSGTNIAEYKVTINSATADKKRTYFGGALNEEFDFAKYAKSGIELAASDIVAVIVTHNRPFIGDFNARIQVVEII